MAIGEGASFRAEEILREVVQLFENGNLEMQPDAAIYNVVIDSWAKTGEEGASSRAEEILDMMEAGNVVQPDSITYASVIDCYSKSNLPDAGKKAEIILNRMIQRYDEDNRRARPTVYAFTSCIDCYAKSSDPESPLRAQNILNRMESSTYAKPNTITLTSLMEAWVNSNNKDSYAHAEKLLERMETSNRNLQPNVVSYTLYLKALRKCEDKNFAVRKAEEVLNKMIIASNNGKRNMRPNRATLNAAYAIFSQNSAKKARHKIEKFKEQIGRIKRS